MKMGTFVKTSLFFVALSGAVFAYLLYYTDPRSGVALVTMFLVSLFVLVTAVVSLVAYLIRRLFNRHESLSTHSRSSIREGVLAAVYAVAILGVATINLLTWWDALLLALSLVLFEVYFSSGKEQVN